MNPTYIYHRILESTNNHLEELADEAPLAEGTVVYCSEQMAGRGQGSNSWESNPNENITCSIYFKPEVIEASCQFQLNKAVCIAICRFLEDYIDSNRIKIKWPNDIYVDDLKIAGILIEHTIMGNRLFQSIVGIGLNVNQTIYKDAPNPVSLQMLTGKEFDVEALLKVLVQHVFDCYQELMVDNPIFDEVYINRLYKKDVFAKYTYKKCPIRAMIIGVNEYGQLLLVDDSNTQYCCNQRELVYIR